MTMNRCTTHLTRLAVVALVAAGVSLAQVAPPAEIKDPKLRALQSRHQAELTAAAHPHPAKSYLTRELGLRVEALFSAERRSIEFATYGTQTVLFAGRVASLRKLRYYRTAIDLCGICFD